MKIYIAGPMRGYRYYNFPEFDQAKVFLQKRGFSEVFNPADWDRENGLNPWLLPPDQDWSKFPDNLPFSLDDAMKRDIDELLTCDAIYMLRHWEYSVGARAEHAIALWKGIEITYV